MNYKIDVVKGMTVLDALRCVKDDIDGTLTYRCSCRAAICGSCAMRINGHDKLACNTQASKELEKHGRLLVEPMNNMTIMKDLVVDMKPFWDHMKRLKPWLIVDSSKPVPEREHIVSKERVDAFMGTPNCISCGACHSSCPAVAVDEKFPGPAALARLYRFAIDSRDDARPSRLEDIAKTGLWWCVRCYECVKACPKDVRPGEVITHLRELSVKEGAVDDVGARHSMEFVNNIVEHGMLNEEKLILNTLGLRALKKLPLGNRMVLKGKYKPLPFQDPIPDIEQIRTIYEEVKKKG